MGFQIFPNVPDVPGVPAVLRFPPGQSGLATATANIVNNLMTVTNVPMGSLLSGAVLSATGLVSGTTIVNQINGIAGGIGQYAVDAAQSFAGNLSSTFTPPDTDTDDALQSDDPSVSSQLQNGTPQWGVFDSDGNGVIVADQVTSVDYDQGWRISSFPVEGGGFESYDKVSTPYESRLRFTSGGSTSNRQKLLNSVIDIAGDLVKYSIAIPEQTFLTANVRRFSFSRKATDGLGLLKVDMEFEEIRETATTTTTNTQAPSGSDQVNDGTKQPQAATTQQSQSIFSQGIDGFNHLLGIP